MKRLQDKVAIVTGGAGGIGSGTVERLIAEGAKVAVADIAVDGARRVAEPYGADAIAIAFDAEDNAAIEAMIEQTVRHFGRLDIIHNNAALAGPLAAEDTTATDISFAMWDRTMAVNVRAYLAACKFGIPHMIRGGGGSIINMASGSGLAGDVVRIAYGTSKAAVMSLTRYIATQYGRNRIRCNAIAPGLILTESAKAATPELLEILAKHNFTPEFGEPKDIAALVAFLASDEARYITGQTIACDGGLLIHLPQVPEVAALQQG